MPFPGSAGESFEGQPSKGVSRFASQAEPQEQTNRRLKPWVTAIGHDQRTNQSSLPDMRGGNGAQALLPLAYVVGRALGFLY